MSYLLSIFIILAWDRNPEPNIAGYRLYWRTFEPTELKLGGPYLFSLDVGNTNRVEFPTVDNVFYDFVVTDYNTSGLESDFSNEIFTINVRDEGAILNPKPQ